MSFRWLKNQDVGKKNMSNGANVDVVVILEYFTCCSVIKFLKQPIDCLDKKT